VSSQVAAIVNGMTLPDKVGQLLVPTVPGRTADAADAGGAGLAPAGRLPVAIPAAAGGQAFAYGTGLSY
jgi:hypothetical protein